MKKVLFTLLGAAAITGFISRLAFLAANALEKTDLDHEFQDEFNKELRKELRRYKKALRTAKGTAKLTLSNFTRLNQIKEEFEASGLAWSDYVFQKNFEEEVIGEIHDYFQQVQQQMEGWFDHLK